MEYRTIKFKNDGSFLKEFNRRVENYFGKRKITGNYKLYIKAAVIILTATGLYLLPYFTSLSVVMYILIAATRGWVMSLAGFNIGHDAIHGSFSKYGWVNKIMGTQFDWSGVSSWFWYWKHNKIHHIFTNTEKDDDLETNKVLRLAPFQKWYPIHRWQRIYGPILYGFEHLHWVLYGDLKKYFTKSVGKTKITTSMTIGDEILFWGGKIQYVVKSLVLPMVLIGFWQGLISFLVMEFVCGYRISIVFQLAHVQKKSQFFEPDLRTGKINVDWGVEQVLTTAEFATDNELASLEFGGLNFQIIHHLRPDISHVHYKSIQKILIETCNDFGLPYNHYDTMKEAKADHFAHLIDMSKNPDLQKVS